MQALPRALTLNPSAQSDALELLERAMELAPHDPLPIALAAWCHAQRGTHHFTHKSAMEKQVARDLVRKASALNSCDARTDALLATAETLGTTCRPPLGTANAHWHSMAAAHGHGYGMALSMLMPVTLRTRSNHSR